MQNEGAVGHERVGVQISARWQHQEGRDEVIEVQLARRQWG